MPVTPYWELHILPMFRMIDVDHMSSFFRLDDYDTVVANAGDINDAVGGGAMPPIATGGPWPDEWVALFARWTAAGFPRLAAPSGVTYTLAAKGLSATGTYAAKDTAWFERLPDRSGSRVYALVIRPGGGSPKPFAVTERSIPAGTASVIVKDKDGEHVVSA